MVADAKQQEKDLLKKAKDVRAKHGGLSIKHIGELRHHMQELPGLLIPENSEDRKMFAMMLGHLKGLQQVKRRMETYLTCNTDQEAKEAWKALRPLIRSTLEE